MPRKINSYPRVSILTKYIGTKRIALMKVRMKTRLNVISKLKKNI